MALRYTPANKLPTLAAEQLLDGPSGVWMESPGRVRRYFRYAPEFIDDPFGTNIFAGLATDIYRSPPIFISATNDALLVGYRTIVSERGFQNDDIPVHSSVAVEQFLDKIASPNDFLNEQSGLRRFQSTFVLDRKGRHERHIQGTTVVLSSNEPSNYGSLLFRIIPKFITLQHVGLSNLPVIVWAHSARYRKFFDLLGVEPNNLIQHESEMITRLDRAIVPSLRNPDAYLDQESYAFMQALADRFDEPPHGRRIYISRLRHGKVSSATRIMLNETELIAKLPQLNFEIIEPEQLSLEEQIATFASADLVVGPSGSAMFNTVFCRPGTKIVDIESEPNWIYAHCGLFASCNLRYGLVVGQSDPADMAPVHRRWKVDIDYLMQRLQAFIHA